MADSILAEAVTIRWIGSFGAAAGLGKPCGIAVDASGTIYVADAGYGQVVRLRPDGTLLDSFGRGEGGWFKKVGRLTSPTGIALEPDGSCWVADARGHAISRFGADGHFLTTFGHKGKAEGELNRPRSIRRDEDGSLWVVDAYNHRVQKLDPSGRVLMAFGHRGSDPAGNGTFEDPSDLAIDAEGLLYVTDTFNHRVQVFDRAGTFVRTFGTWGRDPGQLIRPRGIAVDAEGRVLVTETGGNRVQVFDPEGRSLAVFGGEGTKEGEDRKGWRATLADAATKVGQFDMPYGIAVVGSEILVADNQNRRIVRLGIG